MLADHVPSPPTRRDECFNYTVLMFIKGHVDILNIEEILFANISERAAWTNHTHTAQLIKG